MHAHHEITSFDFRIAARILEQTRDALVSSGADVGPHISTRDGGRVAAFRHESGRIRFEIIEANGHFAEFTFAGATRNIAAKIAATFPAA
jgi:hypothetical protein